MKELIKVSTNENGQQLVSARDLYLGLGLNKAVWSRWYKSNILENEFFNKGTDFIGVQHDVEGNEVQDFAITLEFAKHIAMMARTEKSHEYRNYFIKCEEVAKDTAFNTSKLSKELQAIFAIDEKQQKFDERLSKVENNMTIDYSQQEELRELANKKIVAVLGGIDSPAYKELNKKVFSSFWRDYKRKLDVNSYKNTLVKDFELGRQAVISWQPSKELSFMIRGCNAQMRL